MPRSSSIPIKYSSNMLLSPSSSQTSPSQESILEVQLRVDLRLCLGFELEVIEEAKTKGGTKERRRRGPGRLTRRVEDVSRHCPSRGRPLREGTLQTSGRMSRCLGEIR